MFFLFLYFDYFYSVELFLEVYSCLIKFFHIDLNNKNKIEFLKQCINKLNEIESSKECYKIIDLDIDGKIIKDLGYKGKEIGEKLSFLLDEVIKNPSLNKKDILINLLKL